MSAFYYAGTDENGVLCVEQLGDGDSNEARAARLASTHTEMIYFEVFPETPDDVMSEPALQCDLDDLRREMEDKIEDLRRDIDNVGDSLDALRDEVRS